MQTDVEDSYQRMRAVVAASGHGGRLAEARTRAYVGLAGDRDTGFTLLLDRNPPEVLAGRQCPEIELALDEAQLRALTAGRLSLQAAILDGAVNYRGPVRKLLSMSAVLATALRGFEGDGRTVAVWASAEDDPTSFREREPGDFWAIECRGVRKRFGHSEVLRGIDLGIPEGLITVVLGPSGTGKSVLLKHFTGLLAPDAGDVLVRGESLSGMSLKQVLHLRRRCGVLFQDGALWGSMNVYDNMALPLRQHTDLSEREIAEVVARRLGDVGLSDVGTRMPSELSGGMRKRIGFARALVLEPETVLFDEPDSGLDPVRTALLCDLISQVHSEQGGTYVVVTHDIGTARRIADYMVVLWQGVVVLAGDANRVLGSSDPFVRQFIDGRVDGPLGMD